MEKAPASLVGMALALAVACEPSESGPWSATGQMAYQHAGGAAVALPNGKVLMAGGLDQNHRPTYWVDTDELYDPATGAWTPTGSMADERDGHWLLLLPTGKVLVAGGTTHRADTIKASELYDHVAGSWSPTGSMLESRGFGYAAALLPSGRVLVAGGYAQDATVRPWGPLASAEVYDPAAGTWSATGSMAGTRNGHRLAVLPDGRVLVAGGSPAFPHGDSVASAEVYDPATGLWTATGSMTTPRNEFSMTPLPSGRILVAGGRTDQAGTYVFLANAEVYDPGTGTWTATGSMARARHRHTATLLQSGKVLVAGGGVAEAELFDPATGRWAAAGSMAVLRFPCTATLLPSGRVLVAGDSSSSRAELYSP